MKQVKYGYCFDENGNLVHIMSVSKETRYTHKYYCLQCGQEMIPNLGTKKTWYFSHKAETACDGETYLHKLAKIRIREKFNSSQNFPITFSRTINCREKDSCLFFDKYCCTKHSVKIQSDLKLFMNKSIYDTCQEEISFDSFRPDLLLTNSSIPDRKPVFIEIYKTHQSDSDKVNSDYRIIETKQIITEEDIEDIIQKGFIEDKNCKTYNFKPKLPSYRGNGVPIIRFILHKNGKAFVDRDLCCDNMYVQSNPYSIVELNIAYDSTLSEINNPDKCLNTYQTGLTYLVKKGWKLKNCILCKFYRYSDYYTTSICILYKKLLLNNPTPEQTRAANCQQYEINERVLNYPIEELEKTVREIYFRESSKQD